MLRGSDARRVLFVFGSARSGPSRVCDRLLANEWRTKIFACLMGVMAATPQLQVLRRRLPAIGKRDNMVKFQKPSFLTPAIGAYEGASAGVSFPHGTPNCRRHVTAAGRRTRRRLRSFDLRKLPSLEIVEQHSQRTIEDYCRVAAGHHVPKQVLHLA